MSLKEALGGAGNHLWKIYKGVHTCPYERKEGKDFPVGFSFLEGPDKSVKRKKPET